MSSTSIEYVDVSKHSKKELEQLVKGTGHEMVLLYMPDLDYKKMQEFESLAEANGVKLINIPITLPVMDIVKQAEYAGIEITKEFVVSIRNGIRDLITDTLNEEV